MLFPAPRLVQKLCVALRQVACQHDMDAAANHYKSPNRAGHLHIKRRQVVVDPAGGQILLCQGSAVELCPEFFRAPDAMLTQHSTELAHVAEQSILAALSSTKTTGQRFFQNMRTHTS